MNHVLRALLIATATTTLAAVATAAFSRRARAPELPRPPRDPLYVDADALSDAERQALRDELERMV